MCCAKSLQRESEIAGDGRRRCFHMVTKCHHPARLAPSAVQESLQMATSARDRGRITARVPIQVQQTLEVAASMVGATVNQFVVQAALRAAERVIEEERFIRLLGRDASAFLEALDAPLANDKLLTALQDYATRRDDQTGTVDWAPRPKGA